MRNLVFSTLASLLIVFVLATQPAVTEAQGGSAGDLVAAVNQLRTASSLPALQVNSTLMSIAQSHSNFQASIGSVTHTGIGGTRPRERAVNAGYGDGATIFVTENIAGGNNLSVPEAISWWQGDAAHLNTMLGSSYQEIGAGVATSGSFVYYTIDVGYTSGAAVSGPTPSDPSGSADPGGGDGFSVAEPAADGSITHEVQAGQTLIGIAVAYDVSVAAIQALNELGTTTFIYPGDKLLIQPPFTPTPTSTPTVTATAPRPTRRPPPTATITPSPPPVVAQVDEADQDGGNADSGIESLVSNLDQETDRGPLLLGILGVAFLLLVTPVLLALRKKER